MNNPHHIPTLLLSLLLSLCASTALASTDLAVPDVPDSAYGEGAVDGDNPRVETRLLVDQSQVKPGAKLRVGVLYTLDPDWHVYWRNSGDAGLSTDTDFSSENTTFGELQWPAPHVFVDPGGEVYTFGYSDQVLFFADATVAETASGKLTLDAEVDYLACKIECIPGNSKLTRTLPVATQSTPANKGVLSLFDAARTSVPVSPDEVSIGVEAAFSRDAMRPGDEFRAAVALDFCPDGGDDCRPYQVAYQHRKYALIPDSTAQATLEVVGVQAHPRAEQGQILQLKGRAAASEPRDDERLSGIVHLERDDGQRIALLIDEAFPRSPEGAETVAVTNPLLGEPLGDLDEQTPTLAAADGATPANSPKREPVVLWKALMLAFLGGMILNLMPCVFPVLAIKVSSFAQVVHESKTHILSHGLAYTAGIVSSLLTLALVVIGLRAAGTQVGWGFQFQEPLFIVALCAILVLFALNLFGVFEVSVAPSELADKTRQATGVRRSFGEGVLAVILATPCSAPFLGTAVGFALASSAATILAIFLMLGLGLAAPFVLLTLIPGAAKILPKPGAWMNVLKEVLGFALLGTVIWLAWILGQMTGVDGVVQTLICLSALALGAWFFGKIQYRVHGAKKWLVTLVAIAAVGAVGSYVLELDRTPKTGTDQPVAAGEIDWQRWSEEAVQAELDAGNIVFVDFTADWCITCKANERTIIDTDRVKKTIADNDVVTFKADWTNPDERIRKKLAEYGKGGVPMYLVYRPEQPKNPQVLPELLTVDLVVGALGK
jgi:thiol:disulfide interchange protein DsbD